MAAPFFDPTQWLRTPSPVSTPAFNPQSDILDQLRQQQEEEEEKRLNAEKMLADLIERSRNKKEEERIERLRSEMPQDIYERLHKGYYGDPQSKAGKVGSAILQIGSGLFGTAPDINKASMEQWKAQQTAANAADTIQQREQAAAASAISRMQQSQSRMAETEAKNKTSVVNQLIKADIEDSKRQMDRLKLMSQQGLIDAKTAAINFKTELDKKLMRFTALGKTPVEIQMMAAEANPDMFGEDAAEKIARYFSARKQEEQARPPIPGGTSATTAPVLGPGGEILGNKTSVTQRSERPGIPGRGALIQAATGQTPEQFLTQPQQPQMPQPQPMMGQPAPQPQPQAMAGAPAPQVAQRQTPRVASQPQPTNAAAPQSAQPQDNPFGNVGRPYYRIDPFVQQDGKSASQLKIIGIPRGTFIGAPREPEMSKEERANYDAVADFSSNAKSTLEIVQDAYATGQLSKQFDWKRALAEKLGGGGAVSYLNKNWGDQKTKDLENRFQQAHNFELAAYIKKISGAQVSDKEYERLRQSFADGTIDADGMMLLSYYNAVYAPLASKLAVNGILNPDSAQYIGGSLEKLMAKKRTEYMNIMKDLSSKSNVSGKSMDAKREEAFRKIEKLTNADFLVDELMRTAFPDSVGSTVTIPDAKRRRDLQIYIPWSDPNVEKLNKDRQRARADDEMRRRGLIP